MSKYLDGEIGRRMSDAELKSIEADLKAMPVPEEDKAPFMNLLWWAVIGLKADGLIAALEDKQRGLVPREELEKVRKELEEANGNLDEYRKFVAPNHYDF